MYRDDFSAYSMGELLGAIASGETQQAPLIPIPGRPARLQVWLMPRLPDNAPGRSGNRSDIGHSDLDAVTIKAKLQTAQGEMLTVEMLPESSEISAWLDALIDQFVLRFNVGGRETELELQITPSLKGWRQFETSLPVLPPSSYPLSLHSLWVQNNVQRSRSNPNSTDYILAALDDLEVIDADTGETTSIEDFEDPARIWYADDEVSVARFTKSEDARSGRAVLDMRLYIPQGVRSRGLRMAQAFKRFALPALASPALLESTELQVGETMRAWINSVDIEFEILGTLQYFPTMYEEPGLGYLITSRDALLTLLNKVDPAPANANEVLLESDGSVSTADLEALVPNATQVWEVESVRKSFKADPLALGLRSVTLFGYGLTALLSLVGFATHFYTSARHRATIYGVMRAMGLSPRQLYGSLVLEQIVLILAGLALGTGLGVLLNQLTLARLPITLGDQPPIPPFRPHSDWLAVGRIYVGLALAFLLSLGAATLMLWRARVHRVLRIGQE